MLGDKRVVTREAVSDINRKFSVDQIVSFYRSFSPAAVVGVRPKFSLLFDVLFWRRRIIVIRIKKRLLRLTKVVELSLQAISKH